MAKMLLLHKHLRKETRALAELASEDGDKAKIAREMMEKAKDTQYKMSDGLEACIAEIKQFSAHSADSAIKELQSSLKTIHKPEALKSIEENVLSGSSLREQLGISDDTMQTLYQGARTIFDKGCYVDAAKAFFALCNLEPAVSSYWIGLGHANFQNREYSDAVDAYSMLSMCSPNDAMPHIWAANCFKEQHDGLNEKTALEEAVQILKSNQPVRHEILRSCEERLQTL